MNSVDFGIWHLVTTKSDFLDLESDWERLFQENPRHSPFLAWGWVSAWLKHLAGPHELQIACLRDDSGALVFVLPLLRRTGDLRFGSTKITLVCSYGPECSENLGCLCAASLESQSAELSGQAIAQLFDGRDAISLGCLDSTGNYPSELKAAVLADGGNARVRPDVICPTVSLPVSWDDYLQQLSANFRSQVRRSYKQVGDDGQPNFHSMEPSDAEVFARELIRLNRSRIRTKGEISSLESKEFRAFIMEAVPYMASRGFAWLDIIERDGEVLGSALNFMHGDSVYFYMGGFDNQARKLRPGTALFALVIQRSIDGGYAKYDFLRGAEAYKYRWNAKDILTHRVTIYPRGKIRGHLASTLDDLHIAMRKFVRRSRRLARKRA